MEPQFWLQRWEEGRIGFHRDEVNPHLPCHWPRLAVAPPARVFVPLCGKSLDLLWLRGQGYRVVGVELSALAVETFFSEQGLGAGRDRDDTFTRWRCDGLDIFQGDYFALTPGILGPVDAVYDRAALVALPAPMRARYVAHMARVCDGPRPTLLVTLEFAAADRAGPPFPVPVAEVEALYGPRWRPEILATAPLDPPGPGGKGEGRERVWRLMPRPAPG